MSTPKQTSPNLPLTTLGFPRIGRRRELKRALEQYWKGALGETELSTIAASIRHDNWERQRAAGIDLIASNDFSYYDQVLDTTALVGAIPARFRSSRFDLDTYFRLARGAARPFDPQGAPALEMTKWFDTNYHYLVPEFAPGQEFELSSTKPLDEFQEALSKGLRTKPVILGPVSYLWLGKAQGDFDRLSLLPGLLPVYEDLLRRLEHAGCEWVQIDEPILALDLPESARRLFPWAYNSLKAAAPQLNILLATYFGELGENLDVGLCLPVDALHLDLTRGLADLAPAVQKLPENLKLSLGLVDGRNIWRNDYTAAIEKLKPARGLIEQGRALLAPSSSLQFVPYGLKSERHLDATIKSWLAFADEKLAELGELRQILTQASQAEALLKANRSVIASRNKCPLTRDPAVRERLASLTPEHSRRHSSYPVRAAKQEQRLRLPLFPTTTIGSFPQTSEVRQLRLRFKKGELDAAAYQGALREQINRVIKLQEDLGLDVLVHGEFERNDMVEHFAEHLAGFAFTENGWVQSYGSRCVKPPIIYGDVHRLHPMTVEWSSYAQSLTDKPVKGMLTGPVTMLQWSFVRDDQPRADTTRQIAFALRDEVVDLERAGLSVVQIDEPALREGLPLRRHDWDAYLTWAVEAFRISACGVTDETQIHTHMCYSEFNDILQHIAALDADVLSIESSRSRFELLQAFQQFDYPNQIGPGVWDIHSPRVPAAAEILELLLKAATRLSPERLWVNPDCGLKTRDYPETVASLKNLVHAARAARDVFAKSHRSERTPLAAQATNAPR